MTVDVEIAVASFHVAQAPLMGPVILIANTVYRYQGPKTSLTTIDNGSAYTSRGNTPDDDNGIDLFFIK